MSIRNKGPSPTTSCLVQESSTPYSHITHISKYFCHSIYPPSKQQKQGMQSLNTEKTFLLCILLFTGYPQFLKHLMTHVKGQNYLTSTTLPEFVHVAVVRETEPMTNTIEAYWHNKEKATKSLNDEQWCQLLGSRNQHLESEHEKNWVLDTAESYYCVSMQHGCVSGFRCRTQQFLKKVGAAGLGD